MITCNLAGGLGNQLFQIFAIIAYGIRNNRPFQFLHTDFLGGETSIKRTTYWNTFLQSLKNFTVKTLPVNVQVVPAGPFEYHEMQFDPNQPNNHILFEGYFQSYKYFEPVQDKIYRLIQLNERTQECLQKHDINPSKCISMHFRLGDYKHLGYFHPIMNFQYYKNALTHIISTSGSHDISHKILYFCEVEDNDIVSGTIAQLAMTFPECIFEKINDSMADWEQMLIMSSCQHNIIANSSFSWFGAYLNKEANKIVCYPEQWFCGHGENIYVGDLFPENWTKIQCS